MGVPPNSNRPWDYSARAVGSSANRVRKVDAISDIRNANVWMIEKAKYAHRRARRPEHRAVLGLLGGEAHSLPLSAVPAQHEDKTTTTAITRPRSHGAVGQGERAIELNRGDAP